MLSVDRLISAPATAVWDVLVDLDAWPIWGPSVSSAKLDSAYAHLELNATGTVRTAVGISVPFIVTEFEPGRHWAWKVAGVPATRHRVEPVDDRARASMSVPWWAPAYLAICTIALRRIDAIVTNPSNPEFP